MLHIFFRRASEPPSPSVLLVFFLGVEVVDVVGVVVRVRLRPDQRGRLPAGPGRQVGRRRHQQPVRAARAQDR